MKENIVIFGAGGCGREVMWQLSTFGCNGKEYNILGFVDDTKEKQGKFVDGYPIVGDAEWLNRYEQPINVVICLGASSDRRAVYNKLKKNKYIKFPTLVLGNAVVSGLAEVGEGSIICMDTKVTVGIKIGRFFYSGIGCCVSHDNVIGEFVTLYSNVNISGNVHIGNDTEIGTGAKIIPKVTIGKNVVLGAGAVVVEDIWDDAIAIGVPAKIIKEKSENRNG